MKWSVVLAVLLSVHVLTTSKDGNAQCMVSGQGIPDGMLFNTTGNPLLDKAIGEEMLVLSDAFGFTPQIYALADSTAANAYADCQSNRVLFGLRLLAEELWSMHKGPIAVAGIMAHEFTHLYQCRRNSSYSSRMRELQADFMAGWYLKHKKQLSKGAIQGFANSALQKGDFDFFNPKHHGTPQERTSAVLAGYNCDRSSVSSAYDKSIDYLEGTSGGGNKKICETKVPCEHKQQCQHQVQKSQIIPCSHIAPCGHFVMSPFGPAPAHPYGDIMHPMGDMIPQIITMHPYDLAHEYDTRNVPCN